MTLSCNLIFRSRTIVEYHANNNQDYQEDNAEELDNTEPLLSSLERIGI